MDWCLWCLWRTQGRYRDQRLGVFHYWSQEDLEGGGAVTTPHRSTPEHWAAVEAYAQHVSSTDDCLLELRARVQTLEKRCEVQLMQLSDLQERHHRLTLQVGHLEYELDRDDDDEPQQYCLEALE